MGDESQRIPQPPRHNLYIEQVTRSNPGITIQFVESIQTEICLTCGDPTVQPMAPRPRKLLLPEVQNLIATLLAKGQLKEHDLLTFARVIMAAPSRSRRQRR